MSRAAHAGMVFSRRIDDGWAWTWMCRGCCAGLSVRQGEYLNGFRPGRDGWRWALDQAADHTVRKAAENRRYARATGADVLDDWPCDADHRWTWRVTVGSAGMGGHLSAYACAEDREAVIRWAQEATGQTPLVVPLPRRL